MDADGSTLWIGTALGAILAFAGLALFSWRSAKRRDAAEARAAAAEARLQEIIESLPEGLAVWDASDRLVLANRRSYTMLPASADLMVPGARYGDVLATVAKRQTYDLGSNKVEDYLRARMAWHKNPVGPRESGYADGSRWWRINESKTSDGGTITVWTDITEHQRREQMLAAKTALLETTLESMGEAVSVFDKDLRLAAWNQRYVDYFALPAEIAKVGTPAAEILRFQAAHGRFDTFEDEADVARRLAAAHPGAIAVRATRLDDGRVFEMRRSPMPGGGFVTLYNDVTERARFEEALQAAKEQAETANRTKSDFLANMSHELRTPLNAVIGFSEIMLREMFGPLGAPRYRDYVRDIFDSGSHLLDLVNDLLDLAKVEAGRMELVESEVDIASLVDACLRLVEPRARIADVSLSASLSDELPPLIVDERRMRQILLNLLSNAVKFTPAGGKTAVHAAIGPEGEFVLSVIDSGIGMTPEDIPKALTPFGQLNNALRTKYAGTGLGLPLTKALVAAHGGELHLTSTVGMGTTVTAIFPASRCVARHPTREPSSVD